MKIDAGFLNAERALVLCPHTDDEYGCAGTIARILRSNTEVIYIALSICEESVPEGYPKDILEHECRECTQHLGLKSNMVEIWRYPVRYFPAHRQDILEAFVRINKDFSPNLVFVPTSSDTHQDHQVVCAEAFRAFKYSSMLGYELPQNLRSFENTAFIRFEKEDLDTKIDGLSCYKSQAFRPYCQPDFIKSLAIVRGIQCNAEFAEAFELIRLIL